MLFIGVCMLIRDEKRDDQDGVRAVNASAFETSSEASLVDSLRERAQPIVSLVAESDGDVVGHIMFSPVSLSDHPELMIMGLAPMAVKPACQHKGIGSALVRAGIARCTELGFGAIVVLGHPEFYPRFGFLPASRFGIESEYDVPDDVFMAMEIQPDYLRDATGTIKYHDAFGGVVANGPGQSFRP
jgi:putative acetyltransferase